MYVVARAGSGVVANIYTQLKDYPCLQLARIPVFANSARNAGFIRRQTEEAASKRATVVQFSDTALFGIPSEALRDARRRMLTTV
jgi:hypothetical protein